MSVINKMLKDLEQRKHDSDLDEISSVYRPPVKKPVNLLVILLSLSVVGLVSIVSWLLLKNEPPATSTKYSIEQPVKNKSLVSQELNSKQKVQETEAGSEQDKSNQERLDKEQQLAVALAEQAKEFAKNSESAPSQVVSAKADKSTAETLTNAPAMVPVVVQPVKTAKKQVKPEPAKKAPSQKASSKKDNLKIVKSSKQYTPEQRLEMIMKKAQSSFDKGYINEAVEQLNMVLSISDSHIEARNLLAVAWYGRGELQQAVSILNDGLSKYPSVELWRMTAAKIYFKENNIQATFSYLDAELPNASLEFYSMKASVARKLQLFPSAESAYSMLIKMEPDVVNWWLGHAIALDSQDKFDEAVSSYQVVLEKGGISAASMEFVQQRIQELTQ